MFYARYAHDAIAWRRYCRVVPEDAHYGDTMLSAAILRLSEPYEYLLPPAPAKKAFPYHYNGIVWTQNGPMSQ